MAVTPAARPVCEAGPPAMAQPLLASASTHGLIWIKPSGAPAPETWAVIHPFRVEVCIGIDLLSSLQTAPPGAVAASAPVLASSDGMPARVWTRFAAITIAGPQPLCARTHRRTIDSPHIVSFLHTRDDHRLRTGLARAK